MIFYLSLALGFLAKGPIAWTPLLTVAGLIIYTRDWQMLRRFKFAIGVPLMLVVVALWGIPALIQTHGEFFTVGIGRHVVTRSFMTLEGHGASSFGMYVLLLPFYFVTVFISFFPWSIKLPWLIRKLWRKREAGVDAPGYSGILIDTYLLWGIAIIFVIFTLVSTKLPHYTLPAFPLLALLLARHWHQDRRLNAAAPCSQPSRSQLRVCGSQLPLWYRKWWRGFSRRISSFKCLARLCSRTCNLLRSSSRSQVWSGIFAPAFKVFSRR